MRLTEIKHGRRYVVETPAGKLACMVTARPSKNRVDVEDQYGRRFYVKPRNILFICRRGEDTEAEMDRVADELT